MNNSRRKRINESILALTGAMERMQKALEEEKAALAKIPDTEENEAKRDAMDDIISGLDDAVASLNDAIDTLENADF